MRRAAPVHVVLYDKKKHKDLCDNDGCCLICNRAPRKGVVATTENFHLFYCEQCVTKLAVALGIKVS